MNKWIGVVVTVLCVWSLPAFSQSPDLESAAPIAPLLIVELQTGSKDNASAEFVEIFNVSNERLTGSAYKLQYLSAGGSEWLTKATFAADIPARGRYLFATSGLNTPASQIAGLGLAASGGHVRIVVDVNEELRELDRVAWGTAAQAILTAAPAPAADQSLKRLVDEDGGFIDTDDDALDFALSSYPSPAFTPIEAAAEPVVEASSISRFAPQNRSIDTSLVVSADAQPDSQESTSGPAAPIQITELFIDPEKPLTDADDEFVELYNPTGAAVNLEGYTIETGSSFSYDFTLPALSIKPGQYIALYAVDTGLVLSNTQGAARLIAPNSSVVFEVPAYTKAKGSQSWALVNDQWQWMQPPTPSAANGQNATATAAGITDGLSERSVAMQFEPSTGSAVAGVTGERSVYEEPDSLENTAVDTTVVAGIGSMALLYAGYEYRHDFANRFTQLKRYFASRRANRSPM